VSADGNIARILTTLAVGLGGIVVGGALPDLTSVTGAVAGGAAALGVGVNFTHESLKSFYATVAERLRNAAAKGRLPENHDLARAIRKSHLNALQFLVDSIRDAARHDPTNYDEQLIERFCQAAATWIGGQVKQTEKTDFFVTAPIENALAEVHAFIEGSAKESPQQTLSELDRNAAVGALDEFRAALRDVDVDVPGAFKDWFDGKASESVVGWSAAAKAFFAEKLKTDERLRTVVFMDLLNRTISGIKDAEGRLNDVLTNLRNQAGVLTDRFNHLEDAIRSLSERGVKIDRGSLTDALLDVMTRTDFVKALHNRVGVEAPADAWAASRAANDVRDRIAELSGAFFGREAELAKLDAFVDTHTRGLAIVAAPAGGGKSALLARWLDRRRAGGDVIVRHFISSRFPGTTDPGEALRHLIAQLREIDAQAEAIPVELNELLDKLTARLRNPAKDERLIVIVDGLDELSSPLGPNETRRDVFVRTLADGVFVIVSGRAAKGETPLYLKQWQKHLDDVPVRRFDIQGLSVDDVLIWLEEITGHLDRAEMNSLASNLRKTTDGLPLFLRSVMEDFKVRLPRARSREERLALVASLPAPFSEYVAQELVTIQDDMGLNWTQSARMLFALLTKTRGPITAYEIEAMFSFRREAEPAFPPCPVLTGIDHRVGRWLSIRETSGSTVFAFAHPLLAAAFAEALADDALRAEDQLIEWMESAWRSEQSRRGLRRGADYALDWLPQHLWTLGKRETSKTAAALLSSPMFLKERRPERAGARRPPGQLGR